MTDSFPRPLRGIVPPLATPLLNHDQLDVASLEKLIEHTIAGGVAGLFILGTTGEALSLSNRLRREIVQRTCAQVACRIPVLVCVTDTALAEAQNLARFAADCGAAAVVSSSPFYLPLSQADLWEYVRLLNQSLPLPLFLYNMPGLTKVSFESTLVRRTMDEPNIVGLKDSSGDIAYFGQIAQLLPQRKDWTLLVGPEHLLSAAVALGGHGGVNGGSNLRPRLFVEMAKAAAARDEARVAQLQERVLLLGKIYGSPRTAVSVIRGLKCALHLSGLCQNVLAAPFTPCDGQQQAAIAGLLTELDASLAELFPTVAGAN